MTKGNHSDLLVIGGGVLGTFYAYHALQRGLSVTLLERNLAPQGATVRNFGQVVPSGMNRHWQQFGCESLKIYQDIQSEFDITVRKNGSIYLASDEEELTLIEELHAINASANYPSELWTAQQCRERYPQLRKEYCRGGLFFSEEASVNPKLMIHRLHKYLAQNSPFQINFQTCVQELTTNTHGQVNAVASDGRVYSAEKVVLCCGSEFQVLFPKLFQASDLQAVKLQLLRLKAQQQTTIPGNILTGLSIRRYESFAECPSWETIKSRESSTSFSNEWGIHILFKQEADGGIILGDSHEYEPASQIDNLSFDIRNDINEYFIDEGRKVFNLDSWNIEDSWYGIYCQSSHPSGIYTNTIDNNIHIVTGIGGKGMTSSAGFTQHHLGEIYND